MLLNERIRGEVRAVSKIIEEGKRQGMLDPSYANLCVALDPEL